MLSLHRLTFSRHTFSIAAMLFLLSFSIPASLHAQSIPTTAWFGTDQSVTAPLQPVNIRVAIADYEGPASLVIFDSAGRPVGSWNFTVTGGNAVVQVVPRGALGDHWAALFASGNQVANGIIYRLDAQTTIQTGQEFIDMLYPRAREFMEGARLGYTLDGQYVHGYRSPDSPLLWLRDHYYQGRAFRYFDGDAKSLLNAFRRAQYEDGSFPDFLARPEWGIEAMRTPVEADVEYLFVQAVFEAWQMTGDDAWMTANLPAMRKAINYTLTSPLRWEPSVGLVKRPFTIDTWDFEYGPTTTDPNTGQPAPRHWIDEQTKWGVFHGDNTGLAEALRSLARMEEHVGQWESAWQYRKLADDIMIRLNAMSWNGSFYTHHVKFIPFDVPGVDEARQLSLSNAIALNRGVLSTEQGRAILDEYRSRIDRRDNVSFAEWWSIDPPFPPGSFGLAGRLGELPGEYTNGGVMPLVGGELSRGAFRYGYEDYGFNILQRYYSLIKQTNATFLWYYPTGGPGIGEHTLPTDGWGASAMIGALMEGAAGIEDNDLLYRDVTISPRWVATPNVNNAYVVARYAPSASYVAYRWEYTRHSNKSYLRLQATGSGSVFRLRLMLPPETKGVNYVLVNNERVPFEVEEIGISKYVTLQTPTDVAQVEVQVRS